jgi:glycosyltransferase involved in cell wall biosynthesis
MGHATYSASLRPVIDQTPEVELKVIGLPEQSRMQRVLWRGLPLLAGYDLDMQAARWHAVHSTLARASVLEQVASFEPDVIQVKSHSITFGLLELMDRIPVVPVVDAPVWAWRAMESGRPVRPWSKAMLWPSQRAERAVFSAAPLVLALTEWAAAAIKEVAPDARVAINHPGIDLERFRPVQRPPSDKVRVLFVGGRFETKGGLDLLAALHNRLGHDVELDVVTAEPFPETDGVRLHRLSQDDPRLVALYQQADIFCLPTWADTNPWVVLEALACGVPVVASNIAAIPELTAHGRVGVLVPPRDQEALARALTGLIDDPARRAQLAAAARAHMEELYDARQQVPKLLELLGDVASSRARVAIS